MLHIHYLRNNTLSISLSISITILIMNYLANSFCYFNFKLTLRLINASTWLALKLFECKEGDIEREREIESELSYKSLCSLANNLHLICNYFGLNLPVISELRRGRETIRKGFWILGKFVSSPKCCVCVVCVCVQALDVLNN